MKDCKSSYFKKGKFKVAYLQILKYIYKVF